MNRVDYNVRPWIESSGKSSAPLASPFWIHELQKNPEVLNNDKDSNSPRCQIAKVRHVAFFVSDSGDKITVFRYHGSPSRWIRCSEAFV